MIYKNFQYSFSIAVLTYGNISGYVLNEKYHNINNAFDALIRLQESQPLLPGQSYKIILNY